MANGLTERVAPVGGDPLRTEYRFTVYRRATQKVFLLWLNGRG